MTTGNEQACDSSPIPLVDIQAWISSSSDPGYDKERMEIAKQIKSACEEIGFFAVVNHGVDMQVLSDAWTATTDFFDLPLEEKQTHTTQNEEEYPYGYERSETLTLGKAKDSTSKDGGGDNDASSCVPPPDLKETFAIGPNNPASGMPPRRLPSNPKQMKHAYEKYYTAMEELARTLLRIFAVSLDLPQSWFDNKFDHHMCALRTLNYPPLDKEPLAGQLRAGAHTDYGALTILKSGGPGLQVTKDSKSTPPDQQEWIDVPYLPNAFIINLGDLMQRWTNDKWVSTLHRVIVPGPDKRSARRTSMAFFVNMNGDALIETIESCVDAKEPAKYEVITAKDHIMAKHLASMRAD
eukprot:CAMPEP_0195282952 /NCGR_PEP_ID=MMETSP0707-20130614/1647_1 /TAXON_ID=33640 /ORGANISM="Asterionellopsis glacialis, Strain CCMP134" /LENGTH=351 /DNA_ID=CAMNT_0040342037 /DNA_START=52 /DNA_END=1107 /DNA_ORIENTATION=+